MFAKCSTVVLALAILHGAAGDCPADSERTTPIGIGASGACSVSIGEIHARGERVKFATTKKGGHSIQLAGNVTIEGSGFQAMAEEIHLAFNKDERFDLRLVGDVCIKTDQMLAAADRAEINTKVGQVHLSANHGKQVRLEAGSGESVSRIEAASIRLDFETDTLEATDAVHMQLKGLRLED